MEVIGKSRAKAVIESHLNDSVIYFSDHVRILKCNPYCTGVTYLKEHGVYQWIFQVDDPRENPITAVFFVTQNEEHLDDSRTVPAGPVSPEESFPDSAVSGRCIQWVNAPKAPDVLLNEKNTFVGQANTRICLYHLDDHRTEVHFETDITLDFELSFPLNLMPEGVLKFMTEAIMSKIMQQATESMLCQVQADLCCTTAELNASGGKVER
ncbi:DUF1997 domain-containing protein [Chlorobaculum sp. 24CR]|uniref:DUF1997 domain-containing protein n=1 Tax=Chlorobaculum sp. 24CR TaxID=2508878 RepID=UPI00100B4093|nr:DUF1997 domain-containing protein [Chlorobaculum sp. 24CR]RXK82280.1 DUF1997 domain-containing protein [Chlorobaculum sp. 24CR]